MGDIADYYFDRYPEEFDKPEEITCKRCRKRGLYWAQRDGKWVLLDEATGETHVCSEKRLARKAAKEFDDLS